MQLAENEIRKITEDVWKLVLGRELQPSPQSIHPSQMQNPIAASVQISGQRPLAVVLYCPAELASRAAASMFGTDPHKAVAEDLQDVLCELANMIGGNVKSMLDGVRHLSLPSPTYELDHKRLFRRHVVLSQPSFYCDELPLLVMLLAEDKYGLQQTDF
jgi:hypothetical protein